MSGRRGLVSAAFAALLISVACGSVRQNLAVAPIKPSGIYGLGEEAGWNLTFPAGASGKYTYFVRKNNLEQIQTGEVDASAGKATIEVKLNEPAMIALQLVPTQGRRLMFGAAVEPRKLKPVIPRPRDFDDFWKRKIKELEAIPENAVITPKDSGRPDVEYATVQMDHVNGTHVYGQLAKPKTPGKHPALLLLQWASPPYPLDRSWVTNRAAQGWLTFNIEPHDVITDGPPSYYSSLPETVKNYTAIGQTSRETSYFVEMYLRDYRAVDFLTHQPDWDGKTLVVMGTSMGGQQSLCVAGLHPKITHVIVEEPSGCDMNGQQHGRQVGYPNFTSAGHDALSAAQYVDCINFAPHIRAVSLVAMGFIDNVAAPAGIWTAFNLIRGPKEVAPMPEAPHNNLATAEQQRPYFSRSEEWLSKLLKGEKVDVNTEAGKP